MGNSGNLIITGAGSTIDQATVSLPATTDYNLFLIYRDEDALHSLAAGPPNATCLIGDVTDVTFVGAAFQRACARGPGAAVSTAGITTTPGYFENYSTADFLSIINVTGAWLEIKHALEIMKPRQGAALLLWPRFQASCPRRCSRPMPQASMP